MQRPITGFGTDELNDPVAYLSCGHRQHVRHQPPFINRPWVMSEEGRRSMLGTTLNCVRCDQMEWPEHFVAYKQTPEFTQETLPDGLKKDHNSKAGVWAKIHVLEGVLHYTIESLGIEMDLLPGLPGIVLPEVLHHVAAKGPVRFYVEFYRAPATAAP